MALYKGHLHEIWGSHSCSDDSCLLGYDRHHVDWLAVTGVSEEFSAFILRIVLGECAERHLAKDGYFRDSV